MLRKGCFSDDEIREMDQRTEAYRDKVMYLEFYYPSAVFFVEDTSSQMRTLGNLKQGYYNQIYGNL